MSSFADDFDYERHARWLVEYEAAELERIREAASRRRDRRASRSAVDARQRGRMQALAREAFGSDSPPVPGGIRDRRLRAGVSLRQLALLAMISKSTAARADHAAEAGDRDALRGPTWRSIAAALEKVTGERVKLDDIRPEARDDDAE